MSAERPVAPNFATTCSLCIVRTPVHKDGMCARHYAEFGSEAWAHVGEKPKPSRGFRLQPLRKAAPRKKAPADG